MPAKPAKKTKTNPTVKPDGAPKLKATFQLPAPTAGTVLLAGDFTAWESKPIQMKRDRSGTWKTTVTLEPGRHQYRFMVDGNWENDPSATELVANPFGTENSVLEVASA